MRKCERCNGSGEIGVRIVSGREVPGPVPEDSNKYVSAACPDCGEIGYLYEEGDDPEPGEDPNE